MNALIDRLDGVKARGKGQWIARCPAHDDRDPSLAIREEQDGRILIKCFAGCSPEDVMTSVGLSLSDLFPEPLESRMAPFAFAQVERRKAVEKTSHIERERLVIALAESDRRAGKRQSEKDRKRELEAVRYLINANVEYDPAIVLMAVSEEMR